MSLTPGARLGPYEVVGKIGEGGMGEVYRAKDRKLNRDVALKILPPTVIADPDRRARFAREAQVLAALNHPNIAAIHGFEDSGQTHAIVMELVEGEDLSICRSGHQTDGRLFFSRCEMASGAFIKSTLTGRELSACSLSRNGYSFRWTGPEMGSRLLTSWEAKRERRPYGCSHWPPMARAQS